MLRKLLPVGTLLIGSGFLFFAGGVNGLLLPIRGAIDGFTPFSLGLLGTGWAIGYVIGCFQTPKLVARAGHIRAFGILAASAAIAILLSSMLLNIWVWIMLRAIAGFAFAGAAMIVESWLSEEAEPSSRGTIFGVYTMVNLLATTAGQISLIGGDISTGWYFSLAAIFYCLALIPTAISSTRTPTPLTSVKLDLRGLWKNSPVAVFSVFMIGISNSTFGSLAPVYGSAIGLSVTSIALFTSLPVLAGALAQLPVGALSDSTDRRYVLIALAMLALGVDLTFVLLSPTDAATNIGLSIALGFSIFAMYPIIVSHAFDHAVPSQYIQISGGLLMLFGFGSIIGPLVTGSAFAVLGPSGLFMTTAVAHIMTIGFTTWRCIKSRKVGDSDKVSFVPSPMTRTMTPETASFGAEQGPN
jgi:MFS family permease